MEGKPTPLQPTGHIQWHYLGFSVGYWKYTSNVFFWDYLKQHTHQLDFICMHMSFMFNWLTCLTFHGLYIMFNCSACDSFSFFQTLVTFVNKQLVKVNLEVNDLDTQVNHLFGVSLFFVLILYTKRGQHDGVTVQTVMTVASVTLCSTEPQKLFLSARNIFFVFWVKDQRL